MKGIRKQKWRLYEKTSAFIPERDNEHEYIELIDWIMKREAERGTERMRRKWLRFIAFSSVLRMRWRAQAERDRTRKKEKTTESERERERRRKEERERQANSSKNTCAIGMNKNIYCDYLFCQRCIFIYMLVIPMTNGGQKFVSTNWIFHTLPYKWIDLFHSLPISTDSQASKSSSIRIPVTL